MMSEVCKDTKIDPKLIPSPGEELQDRTSNNSIKERVDIRRKRWQEAFSIMDFRLQQLSLS